MITSGIDDERRGMMIGTVKWFNRIKGFGMIQPDGGSKDAFVHIDAVERAGLGTLKEGQKVQFDLVHGPRGEFSVEKLAVLR